MHLYVKTVERRVLKMAQIDESDGQKRWQWRSRLAQSRLDLSASVEATLAEEPSWEDLEPEEEEDSSAQASVSGRKAIISPRLSLQSKPMPAVRPDASLIPVKQNYTHLTSPTTPVDGESGTGAQNANVLARIAQRITSSLGGIGSAFQTGGAGSPFTLDRPGTHNLSPVQPGGAAAMPSTQSSVAAETTNGQKRLAGRTTRVRLKAVPKPDRPERQAWTEVVQTETLASTNTQIAGTRLPVAAVSGSSQGQIAVVRGFPSGSGMFESGQGDVAVANSHITSSSVVAVMLAGDPGPVVVQYVSLQPQVGFTVHLSAPAKVKTPFNYVILAGDMS